MLDWLKIQEEYDQIVSKLSDPGLDTRVRADLQRKTTFMADVLQLHNQIVELEKSIQELTDQRDKETGELKELYHEEILEAQVNLKSVTSELEDLLYPADERNKRAAFVEIRAGAGGQEAALFVSDLFKMYNNYALSKGWEVSIVEAHQTDLGGYKELVAYVKGKNVYKFLKFESGVHRVQRVPKTETAGRIHTSTVTVAVMPEVDDVEISINPSDLRIDTYRSSGAGGQHVNTTDSAIRITHIPSGLVVTCQEERSQGKNKVKAMKVLQARLFEQEKEKQEAEMSAQRKQQVGTGDRAEKIRTYNFPQNRITDHRVDVTLKKLDLVMEGDLDDLLNPLLEWDMVKRRSQGLNI